MRTWVYAARRAVWGVGCFAAGLAAGSAQTNPAPGGATVARAAVVERVADVVRQWRPDQRLYVKGRVGVSGATLDWLESWLDQHATNWMVVLAENAEGETYTDAEGGTFQDVEAANHALGKGLMNQTSFGQQTDSRTGERNAAFFILFLKERRLSYYGSEAQDKRGLGEDRWPGMLDQPAVNAMRNGARVVDAAKDTIANIERRLTERIAAEGRERVAREESEKRRKEQSERDAAAALEKARADFLLVESKSGEFSRRFGKATGDLGRPDMTGLRSELAAVQAAADLKDGENARRLADALHARTERLLRALDQYPEDRGRLDALLQRLEAEGRRAHAGAAKASLQAARDTLDSARREYDRGDSAYLGLLEAGSRAVDAAATNISAAQKIAERQRTVLAMSLFAMLAGAAVVGLILNRRRLPVKTEARHLHELWGTALGEKTAALFALLDRRTGVVGESEDEAIRRYSGGTLRLGRQIIQDVDELFIMSSCAGRILQQASALIDPAVVWPRLANLFSSGRYRRAIALLRDHPIEFKPEEGLELVVRGSRTERDRLIGDLQSYRPFTMTFNELVEAFNQRARRALAGLDELEEALRTAPGRFETTAAKIEAAQAEEPVLAAGTREDGWLDLGRVFADLLPAARQSLAQARQTAVSDPVEALRLAGARAAQQADDAAALVQTARAARETALPNIRSAAESLAKQGLDTRWLGDALAEASKLADEAAKKSGESSAEAEVAALNGEIELLARTAAEAAELDRVRREQSAAQIAAAASQIKQAREELGAALKLAPGEVLREEGRDPTEAVAQAEAQLESAAAALSRGDVAAARSALEAVGSLASQADAVVRETRDAFAAHPDTLKGLKADADHVAGAIPDHAQILAEMKNGYAPSVLALGAGDLAHPNANGTLEDNLPEAERHLGGARAQIAQAANAFKQAKLLESAARLRAARAELDSAGHRLSEIREKRERLAQTEAANGEMLEKLEQRRKECERLANEPATMAPTVQAYEQAARALEDARLSVSSTPGDPFASAETLARVGADLDSMADQARCDRDVHEQAGRSLAAAESQVAEAERIAIRTATDNLPDSLATQQARGIVASLGGALRTLRTKHQEFHGDWHAIDEEATGSGNRAAAAAATLKGELAQAEASVAALAAASGRVRAAGAWTGGYGVMIAGTPGSDFLSQARGHLERGEYAQALRVADNARRMAERAIAQAQAEVQRRRLEEEARIEAERRRRRAAEARRSSTFSSFPSGFGGGSHGSGGGGSSWGSSGSGTRSSGFSSGSGVSTSSW